LKPVEKSETAVAFYRGERLKTEIIMPQKVTKNSKESSSHVRATRK